MKSTRLIKAIEIISKKTNAEVIHIEFEDGSGNNFNYIATDDHVKKFINLKEELSEVKSHENLPETL